MLVNDPNSLEYACSDILQAYEASKDGVEVTIKEVKTNRSTLQNAFYWATVQEISKFMIGAGCYVQTQGVRLEYSREMVHDINKSMSSISSTTKLSVKEFIDYMDSITAFWVDRTSGNWQPLELVRNYVNKQGIKENE